MSVMYVWSEFGVLDPKTQDDMGKTVTWGRHSLCAQKP